MDAFDEGSHLYPQIAAGGFTWTLPPGKELPPQFLCEGAKPSRSPEPIGDGRWWFLMDAEAPTCKVQCTIQSKSVEVEAVEGVQVSQSKHAAASMSPSSLSLAFARMGPQKCQRRFQSLEKHSAEAGPRSATAERRQRWMTAAVDLAFAVLGMSCGWT
jgi:hypothetical protein